ncbi:MAG: hypothetical protein IJ598_11655, partial [Ruminococcus sp.]|nr:hypothetical protein [Ruminococcus sp.]
RHLKGFKKIDPGYTIDDVLDVEDPGKREVKVPVHKEHPGVSGNAEKVYRFLKAEPLSVEEISTGMGMPVYQVIAALAQLEVNDLVKACRGRRFVLK